jgi:hypothetical protein
MAEAVDTKPDALDILKQHIVDYRGIHLQARAAMMVAAQVRDTLTPGGDLELFENISSLAHALGELNVSMGKNLTILLAQIHSAEKARASLH